MGHCRAFNLSEVPNRFAAPHDNNRVCDLFPTAVAVPVKSGSSSAQAQRLIQVFHAQMDAFLAAPPDKKLKQHGADGDHQR